MARFQVLLNHYKDGKKETKWFWFWTRWMSWASAAIQMAVLDAQKTGKPETLFGNRWHKMIPKALGAREIVVGEQVEWAEQSCSQQLCIQGRGKRASKTA